MAMNLIQQAAHGKPSAQEGQTFALLLRSYRKYQGWTQAELAEAWNYSFEAVSAWERGKRFPGRVEVPRLAHLLEMDAGELVEVILYSKRRDAGMGERGPRGSRNVRLAEESGPFPQGRLFWTLHLGMEHGQLQCVITCPLASGEVWEQRIDTATDGPTISQLHQIVHQQLAMLAEGSATNGGEA